MAVSWSIIILLLVIGIILILWQANARAREAANVFCKEACKQYEVQLLDGTIALQEIKFKRRDDGKVGFLRRYQFDFYNGEQRLTGKIATFQQVVIELYLEKPFTDDTPNKRNMFNPANQTTSNVIPFPGKKKE